MIKASILRFAVVFMSILVTVWLTPGLAPTRPAFFFFFAMLVAFVNIFLKSVMIRFSAGCSMVSLGPILLAINTSLLWLAGKIPAGVVVEGVWPALWGGLVISVVSFIMYFLVSDGQ